MTFLLRSHPLFAFVERTFVLGAVVLFSVIARSALPLIGIFCYYPFRKPIESMHFKAYKSSPLLKFQKRVRFNKKVSQYGKRTFNPNIKIKASHIKTMRVHFLPSVNANTIRRLEELTIEAINTMEFRRETHDSHLSLGQIAKQQLNDIREIKSKIKNLRKNEPIEVNEQNENENYDDNYNNREGDAVSRDESVSRLYHDEEESMGCLEMDSMSLSFEGFDAPTAHSAYPHTENNILFQEQFDFDNMLFRND